MSSYPFVPSSVERNSDLKFVLRSDLYRSYLNGLRIQKFKTLGLEKWDDKFSVNALMEIEGKDVGNPLISYRFVVYNSDATAQDWVQIIESESLAPDVDPYGEEAKTTVDNVLAKLTTIVAAAHTFDTSRGAK